MMLVPIEVASEQVLKKGADYDANEWENCHDQWDGVFHRF